MRYAKILLLITLAFTSGCAGRPAVIGNSQTLELVEPDSVLFVAQRDTEPGYLLGPGDTFNVDFLFERSLNTRVKVRPDGFVALPVVDEVRAAGRTPAQLDSILTGAYSTYYREPEITVNVLEFAPISVYILGEVRMEKGVAWRPGLSVLQALSEAGGPLASGNLKSVVILRKIDNARAYAQRVNLHDFLNGNAGAIDFYLQPQDIVFVPQTFIARINQFVDQFFLQNMSLPLAYIRGWEAFHTEDVYDTFLNPIGTTTQP